jgi:NAD(P)-dependent dehydrogenase (short-subunit alcohol dehydrogenase family)
MTSHDDDTIHGGDAMSADLQGLVAIVTTAGEEEGITAAEGLLRAGATVSLWDTDKQDLDRAAADFEVQGLRADYRVVDVANLNEVQAAYDAVRGSLGAIDLLMNNATLRNNFMFGQESRNPAPVDFWDLPHDRVRRTVDVNVVGAFNCARVVAVGMIARKRGSIIITTTSPSTQRSSSHIPYGPSKAFIEAFVSAAAEQLKAHGVRINCVGSGGRVNRRGESDPTAQPADGMVPVVLYLASNAARDVTGQVFTAANFNPEAVGTATK